MCSFPPSFSNADRSIFNSTGFNCSEDQEARERLSAHGASGIWGSVEGYSLTIASVKL